MKARRDPRHHSWEQRNRFLAKGRLWRRIRSTLFLLPAWFAPHKSLRVLFHRLRGVRIGQRVEIGYYCIIGNVHPSCIHIADEAIITANSVILEHDNSYYYTHGYDVRFGEVHIGARAFVGIGTVILPGVTIGSHAIVGALSLVTSDVPPYTVVAGQPARIIKRILPQPSAGAAPPLAREVPLALLRSEREEAET